MKWDTPQNPCLEKGKRALMEIWGHASTEEVESAEQRRLLLHEICRFRF